MSRRRRLRQYRVHARKVVVVTQQVAADDQYDAIDEAEMGQDWYVLFRGTDALQMEYGEATESYLVDVVGDNNFHLSRWFDDPTGSILYDPVQKIIRSRDDQAALQAAIEEAKKVLRTFL